MRFWLALFGAMTLVAGCASKSEDIQASYVSPMAGQTAAELASLKGQMKAIEQTSIKKNCGIQFRKA